MANFCCSIELEPKTLTPCQLTQAREVALDMVRNNEPEEATCTVVKGLKPVTAIKETVVILQEIETLSTENGGTMIKEKVMIHTSTSNVGSQDVTKEPLSSPF